MARDEIHRAITDYLSLFRGNIESLEMPEESLSLALDRLALSYHFADCDFDEADYPEVAEPDFYEVRSIASSLFPDFGYYKVAAAIGVKLGEPTLRSGNALDDISEIFCGMLEANWLWENSSVENALRQFRWGYENHWEERLRLLQLYLFERSRDT